MKGRVKWYNYDKGYGFIESDMLTVDIFVHRSGANDEYLKAGDLVEFDIVESLNRHTDVAGNVRVIEETENDDWQELKNFLRTMIDNSVEEHDNLAEDCYLTVLIKMNELRKNFE